MNKPTYKTNMVNKLQELSRKMDAAKNKMFFLHEVTNDLETYAVKFDNCEAESAQWLSYEYSRVCAPLMSLLSNVSDDIINMEKSIDEIIDHLVKAEEGEWL